MRGWIALLLGVLITVPSWFAGFITAFARRGFDGGYVDADRLMDETVARFNAWKATIPKEKDNAE
jgi:hypothetical protein